jgi:hypothetical protein
MDAVVGFLRVESGVSPNFQVGDETGAYFLIM